AQRLATQPGIDQAVVGDAELDVALEKSVEDRIGNLVAHLVGMTFRNRFAREQKILVRHVVVPLFRQGAALSRRTESVWFLQPTRARSRCGQRWAAATQARHGIDGKQSKKR